MKDKQFRSSIRVRYALVFTAILVASLAAILIVNRLFLERFYNAQQIRAIDAAYTEMGMLLEDTGSGTLRSGLNELTEEYGMSVIVMTDESSFLTVGAERSEYFMLGRLFGYRYGEITEPDDIDAEDLFDDDADDLFDDDTDDPFDDADDMPGTGQTGSEGRVIGEIVYSPGGMETVPRSGVVTVPRIIATRIEDRGQYTVYRAFDGFSGNDYLEAWGSLDDHHTFLIRMPLESIARSVDISNRFFLFVGVIVTVIGLIASFLFMRRITRPIVDLTGIAEKMSGQDFSARYRGGYSGELDVLGTSMNTMADNLESAIGDLKAANEELTENLAYREKMDGMRSEFISAISHDLKTPLALIQGYAEGLKEGLADDPESRDYYCEVISDEAVRMNSMMQKFIALNEIEYGSDGPVPERFDIAEMLESTAAAYALKAEQDGVRLECGAEKTEVSADEFMVEEVLNNYLSNAFHYVQDKGDGKVIRLSASDTGEGTVRVSVFNTGEGIDEADLGRIWDKLYRSDRSRSREYGGNGIGLSIVKAIMDRHGRECGVYNTPEGPVFWFELAKEECDDRDH
ncbi:MAG: HAMP domain-containing protein [Lachnospiraceae bacterium]|nr:HAMP domain-containing protein [Lachnospiraceae bacterium]